MKKNFLRVRYCSGKGTLAANYGLFRKDLLLANNYRESDGVHTCLFCRAGEFAVSVPEFLHEGICKESLIVRQYSLLLSLSYENFITLRSMPSISLAVKGIIAQHLMENRQRIRSLLYDNPAVRLQKLLQRYPELLKFVHRAEIASYLGLSRSTVFRLLVKYFPVIITMFFYP